MHKVHTRIILGIVSIAIIFGVVYVLNQSKGASGCDPKTVVLELKLSPSYTLEDGSVLDFDGKNLSSKTSILSYVGKDFDPINSDQLREMAKSGIPFTVTNKSTKAVSEVTVVSLGVGAEGLTLLVPVSSCKPACTSDEVLSKGVPLTLITGDILDYDGTTLSSKTLTLSSDGKDYFDSIKIDVLKKMVETGATLYGTNRDTKEVLKIGPVKALDEKLGTLTLTVVVDCDVPCRDTTENKILTKGSKITLENGSILNFDGKTLSSKNSEFTTDGLIYKDNFNSDELLKLAEMTSIKQQPINQQPINQQPIKQQPINQQPINQQPINQQPRDQKPIAVPAAVLSSIKDGSFNSMNLSTKNEENIVVVMMDLDKLELTLKVVKSCGNSGSVVEQDDSSKEEKNTNTRHSSGSYIRGINSPIGLPPATPTPIIGEGGKSSNDGIPPQTPTPIIGEGGKSSNDGIPPQTPTPIIGEGGKSSNDDNLTQMSTSININKTKLSYTEPIVNTDYSCPEYLTKYIKISWNNDKESVVKLQKFLKDYEGFNNLKVDGIYGLSSFDAVKKFQSKYLIDVLHPWKTEDSTGFVYKTTRAKINQLYCEYNKQ